MKTALRTKRVGRRWRLLAATLGLLGLSSGTAWAQQVLVQANVAEDTVKNQFGPNRRYFGHAYVGYGLVAGAGQAGSEVRYGVASSELRLGGRLKLRLNQLVALNLDLGYGFLRYELRQNARKTVPTPAQHQSENLGLHRLYVEGGVRLNAGRRGNAVGSYLDLLAGGGWLAGSSHATADAPGPGIGSVETTERGLPYLRRWTYGVGARLGYDRYALTARYRRASVFTAGYAAWPDLPRWVLGLEVGLF